MDYLQQGIHLRGVGGMTDPLVIYKNEAFSLFGDLMNMIWADFAQLIYHVEVTVEEAPGAPPAIPQHRPSRRSSSATGGARVTYSGGSAAGAGALAAAAAGAQAAESHPGAATAEEDYEPPPPVQQRRVDEHEQLGRNDPCWCGSGKKFKRCHGA
jgi:preprotein translocase subunit SecA